MLRFAHCLTAAAVFATPLFAADEPPVLKVPEGFQVELVAGPPLVDRPITAAFDERGRLYVADSSGSNDPVDQQLAERPHRIVRLEDTDGDGRFDRSTQFADRMMFPEGTLFYDGSLYVSTPPSIWKLTDTNDDGVADERSEWFQGGTLTGCANDLHGPYLGPDGWIYWCKGAFAEQTHLVNGKVWKSKAAHLFRCRPDGTGLEPVMTGGMDNPVDVTFTPEGERILSSTFLVHPGNGDRDGLVHAVYGAMFGKPHGVLDGHPRTGELLPILAHFGSAAPCGLERYDCDAFGDEYRDNLFCSKFNLREVSRHVLWPQGSTFAVESSLFVTSDHVDFHPTDVVVDADGSLLVVNTGGWYKLCCPTSQLWKPDVLGGIYRVTKVGAPSPSPSPADGGGGFEVGAKPASDPRGLRLKWDGVGVAELWERLGDGRSAVRARAARELAVRRETDGLRDFLRQLDFADNQSPQARTKLHQVWALVRVDTLESHKLVREALEHENESVRRAALHGVSLHRDGAATERLLEILADDTPGNRRVAAEALGRIGDPIAVPHLLSAAERADDRMLQHAVCFALIELGDAGGTRAGLASQSDRVRALSAIALDQIPGGDLNAAEVVPLLDSPDESARASADWIVRRHPEWGGDLADWMERQLENVSPQSEKSLAELLVAFGQDANVQSLIARSAVESRFSIDARRIALEAMGRIRPDPPPSAWLEAVATTIEEANPQLLPAAVKTARAMPLAKARAERLDSALRKLVDDSSQPVELRIEALATLAPSLLELSPADFDLLRGGLSSDSPVHVRSAAADALSISALSPEQLVQLCPSIESAGPLELHRLISPFGRSSDGQIALALVASLEKSAAISALRIDVVRETLQDHGPDVQAAIDKLHAQVNVDLAKQRKQMDDLLPKMASGDVRRGHRVFHSTKAACSVCHRMGYAGGMVGPDLSRIGEVRTERDLLESILFPSLSFVRSYEPSIVQTLDGRTFNGVVRDENAQGMLLATGPDQEVRIGRDEIDDVLPSRVSVMPAGLDQQLSVQELADLVAFLKEAKGR